MRFQLAKNAAQFPLRDRPAQSLTAVRIGLFSRALRLIDNDYCRRRHDWLELESELLLEGDENRRTGRGWEGEITWARLVVGCGFDFGRFQLAIE